MPYAIRSLFNTRKDPHRRGHKDPFINRGRVQLGKKRLKGGQRIFVSDEWYAANKGVIEQYLAAGAISVAPINGSAKKAGAPGGAPKKAAPVKAAPAKAEPKPEPTPEPKPAALEPKPEPEPEPVKAAPPAPKAAPKAAAAKKPSSKKSGRSSK